ncbi:MAG: UDP-2,3-diacylglucosamine diphosphatase [Burkholderiaceae bacterium]|nr:UDP-2,3-diacylglucosamine diphosphatase [Burkholderiaceae bacterium]
MIEIGRNPADVALFASDMHLGEHDEATATQFLAAFDRAAAAATHVFLLGDLFEAWAGDDQPDAVASAFIARLAALARQGVALFVVRGNRDFLLDVPLPGASAVASFSQRSGAALLDDPSLLRLFGRRVLIAHGDALCTGDLDYQRARDRAQPRLASRLPRASARRADGHRAPAARHEPPRAGGARARRRRAGRRR